MVPAVSPTGVAPYAGVDTESTGSGGGLGSDSPARKKRRSWKQHRVEAMDVSYVGVGLRRTHDLYACDQCDKMFGKQSSLARHKYEHSGTTTRSLVVCCCHSSVTVVDLLLDLRLDSSTPTSHASLTYQFNA